MAGPMDDLARRYLLLVLRTARHHAGFLVAYDGPDALREVVAGEAPTPPAELHDEAVRLHEEVSTAQTLTIAEKQRARWLASHASALSAIARLEAQDLALPDLAESLCDLVADREPESVLAAAHRLLDAALPPGPSLRARLAAHAAATLIPTEQVPTAVEALTGLLRDRTAEDVGLASGEALSIAPVHAAGESWHARWCPEAGMRGRLELNLSMPWHLDDLARSAGGDGYPGRHAFRVGQLGGAAASGGRDEVLAWCRPMPAATIEAGLAGVGRELLLGDFELAAELRRLGRELGLRWDVERGLEVARARDRLSAAVANAVLLLHHDGLPEPEVRGYLAETALLEPDVVDRVVAGWSRPLGRVEPFARAFGPRLVRDWLAVTGQTDGLRRLLSEQLTPGQLRDDLAS